MEMEVNMDVLNILELLASSPKRNDKLEILNQHSGNDLLTKCFYYALNPHYTYNIKAIPPYVASEQPQLTLDDSFHVLDSLRNREFTGNNAINLVSETLSMLSKDDAVVFQRILSRDLRCGVSRSTINKVHAKLVPTYPCLLGEPFSLKVLNSNFTAPYIAQLKSDGCRANVFVYDNGKVEVKGRSGKSIMFSDMFAEEFVKLKSKFNTSMVFDGELVVVDADEKPISRKKGNGIINKAIRGTISDEELSSIRIKLWDMIPYDRFIECKFNMPYSERLHLLTVAIDSCPSHIYELIETKTVNDIDEAQEYFKTMLSIGEEGIMLKDRSHIWEDKRSKKVLKFKADRECELRVTKWIEGTGKYTGMLGCLQCESEDGLISVSVGSGFDDKQRATIKDDIVGSIVTVRFNEVIESKTTKIHSLFLPRLVEIRSDKDVADSSSTIFKL